MYFKQFVYEETGCATYLIASRSSREAVVVDPQEEIGGYLDHVKERGYHIIYVVDTRVHDHHLSGGRQLAMMGGARYLLHESAEVDFPCRRVKDGQVLRVGQLELEVLHTPGVSPDAISLLVTDTSRSTEPAILLSGDSLFLGDAARPGPSGPTGTAAEYDSIQRLLRLPDYVEVFPAHFGALQLRSGQDGGRDHFGRPSSTIGYERRYNSVLQLSRDAFLKLAGQAPERSTGIESVNRGIADHPDAKVSYVALKERAPEGDTGGVVAAPSAWAGGPYDPYAKYSYTTAEAEYLCIGGISLMARIYIPDRPKPYPAIMDIHGGAWTTGDRYQNRLIDEVLVESGLLVVALDHRLSPQHPYPAQVQDVNLGIRWGKAHVAEYGGIPETLGAVGTSSGGHILMLNAMRPHDPLYAKFPLPEGPGLDASIAYYLGLWAVLDPLARYRYQKEIGGIQHLVRNSEAFFGDEETMRRGNPQTILDEGSFELLPPAMVVEPYPDEYIPEEIPIKFVESYRARGGHIERFRFNGVPHGFVRTDGKETENALNAMKEFIARQLAAITATAGRR